MALPSQFHPPADTGEQIAGPLLAANMLADLLDVLLPGDGEWPSGRTVGIQAFAAFRMVEQRGEAELARLTQAILRAGGPFAGLDETSRVDVARRLEAAEPELFGWVRDAAFIAYYENPFVAGVIRAKGRPYAVRPHRQGYPVARFDLERDTPRHGRGRYVATDAVRRVDAAALDLDRDRTQAWGLER